MKKDFSPLFFAYFTLLLGYHASFHGHIKFAWRKGVTEYYGSPAVIIGIILLFFSICLFYNFIKEFKIFIKNKIINGIKDKIYFVILLPVCFILFLEVTLRNNILIIFSYLSLFLFFISCILSLLFCFTLNFSNDIFTIKESEKVSLLQAIKQYWGIINSRVRNRMSESKIPYYKALYRQLRDQHQEFYYPEENNPDETNKTDSIK